MKVLVKVEPIKLTKWILHGEINKSRDSAKENTLISSYVTSSSTAQFELA